MKIRIILAFVLLLGLVVLFTEKFAHADITTLNPLTTPIIVTPTSVLTRAATAVIQTPSAVTCGTPFVFTKTGAQVYTNGQTVTFAVAPCATTGPAINTVYYVTDATGNLFHLSTTTSNAQNINGTGGSSLNAATLVYAPGDVLASSYTAGSIAVPTVAAARVAAGNFFVPRARLVSSSTAGWGGALMTVNFWNGSPSFPTYTFGDASPWTVATGATHWIGSMQCTMVQFGDGASCILSPSIGSAVAEALASGQNITWDLVYNGPGTITTVASQTWTLTLEDWQN